MKGLRRLRFGSLGIRSLGFGSVALRLLGCGDRCRIQGLEFGAQVLPGRAGREKQYPVWEGELIADRIFELAYRDCYLELLDFEVHG